MHHGLLTEAFLSGTQPQNNVVTTSVRTDVGTTLFRRHIPAEFCAHAIRTNISRGDSSKFCMIGLTRSKLFYKMASEKFQHMTKHTTFVVIDALMVKIDFYLFINRDHNVFCGYRTYK